jgi:hypothetical protein
MDRTRATILTSSALLLTLLCGIAKAEWVTDRKVAETLARVAAYSRCREELAMAGYKGQREALRKQCDQMAADLRRDNIDYESFIGIRGRCEDIMGDWFFDGAWISNSVYWRLFRFFNVPRHLRRLVGFPKPADDLTEAGGIPDSAIFFNTDLSSVTPDVIRSYDESIRPQGAIKITRQKKEGKSKGFFGVDERGEEYIFIVDPPGMEEQVTAAEVIGSTLIRMAGYNVPSSAIVTIQGTGNAEFDGRRSVATRLVEGYKGHWRNSAFKNRREMRATMIFAGWIHNTDWVDHNTGISVVKLDGVPLTRYYIFDFGGSLGSWNIRIKEPRDGWEHYVSFHEFFLWPVMRPLEALGLRKKPYQETGVQYSETVGYLDSNFRPDRYRPNYPNMAWAEMTREDGLWAARLIARYSEEQIKTAVDLARYSRAEDAEYVYRTLLERRKKILDFYTVKN